MGDAVVWPSGWYGTIYADPPWEGRWSLNGGPWHGGAPYPTMSLGEVLSLPVRTLSMPHASLWLWVPNSLLEVAYGVVRAWGFRPSRLVTWDKIVPSLGSGIRAQSEQLVVGLKGKETIPTTPGERLWTTIVRERRRAHSQKPDVVYEMIEDLASRPRVELFARRHRPGWDAWGDEVPEVLVAQGTEGCV